jgi:hypothetical protein
MRFLELIEGFVYRSHRTLLIVGLLTLSFIKTGVWYMPNFDGWKSMRINPFHNPFGDPNAHYLFWNWLGPFLAWRFRIHNSQSFLYFHLAFSLAFTASYIWFVFSNLEERDARTALVLFLVLPVSATAYFWVGMDSITLALMMWLLYSRRHLLLTFFFGIGLGMQHAEQGGVAFAALLCALILSTIMKFSPAMAKSWAAISLAGVLAGKLILVLIFHHYGIQVNSGRPYYLHQYGEIYATLFYYHFQYVLWSILGAGWIVVAKYAERGKSAVPFLLMLLGLLLMLPLIGDETRALAIVTFPVIAAYLLLNRDFLQSLSSRFVCWIFGIWVLVPWPWAWGGRPLVSVFPYNIVYLLHRLFGWFSVPTDQPMWPFLN